MTGRIVRSTDFERVLRTHPRAKSAHFALHHVRGTPSRFVRKQASTTMDASGSGPSPTELSTAGCDGPPLLVDDSDSSAVGTPQASVVTSTPEPLPLAAPRPASDLCWIGTVVPKRHARRSVTRSLLKRQMYAVFEREAALPDGLWVVRLRAAFDVKRFPSAASDALRQAVRQELDAMLSGLTSRLRTADTGT